MVNLKDDFRDWLIKQGLSEKTATGRHGTVYEYVRRIDKLCNLIYKGYDLQPWRQLAEDIYPILGFHLLCRKGDVCVTQNNIAEIKDFLNTFLSDLRQYQDNLKNYFEVKLLLDDGDYVEQYTLIKDLLPSLTTQTLLLKFSDSATQVNKNRNALEKFYQFLSDTQYINDGSCYYESVAEKKDIKNFYDQLTKNIDDIVSYKCPNDRYLELMSRIVGGTAVSPPQIDNNDTETEVHPKTICDILRISERTRKRLRDEGILVPLLNGNYLIDDVNNFIQDRFVKSKYHQNTTPYSQWWDVDEAHKNTGIHRKKLQRLRNADPTKNEVAYVKITERIYIYYPPDVKRKA